MAVVGRTYAGAPMRRKAEALGITSEYYFPGRYEVAFAATFNALLVGLPVFGAFVALLVVYFKRSRGTTP